MAVGFNKRTDAELGPIFALAESVRGESLQNVRRAELSRAASAAKMDGVVVVRTTAEIAMPADILHVQDSRVPVSNRKIILLTGHGEKTLASL